ncbi:hypothetical protein ZWY2020_054788 [Hordeum vulgare]|nr:hypothetical protein ZWY2020_054788 [Hordeum vulgare]
MVATGDAEDAAAGCRARAALLGAYELGRTLGEGSFGKVKHARHRATGDHFAVKILDRGRVLSLRGADDQVRREIATLTMLAHPNVVRLHEVAASKTKIYMVLEFVNGGELFDRIAMKKTIRTRRKKTFQQLIDGVSYCHGKGVYHRDLKPESVLIDRKGNIKISDFGLCALPQHLRKDGLLHTTCGSPNYIAPEDSDGSLSDIWSCGVILYIMLVGQLPFDDEIWLFFIRRSNYEWFQKDYIPVGPYDDDDEDLRLGAIMPVKQQISEAPGDKSTRQMNAFQLIGMASSLDLSGFFEEEGVSQRKIRFTSALPPKDLFDKIEVSATQSGFHVQRAHSKVFELGPSLHVVELELCDRISSDLRIDKIFRMEQLWRQSPQPTAEAWRHWLPCGECCAVPPLTRCCRTLGS